MNEYELNPFEIKAEIARIFEELNGVKDFENYQVHYRLLDLQEDKSIIIKLLLKEINNPNQNSALLKFLLLRYCPAKDLTEKLWNIIKNSMASNQAKIFALDLLRDIDSNWTYEECEQYLDNPDELIEADTKQILNNALVDPEVQIDFLDFLNSLSDDDKVTLLQSLGNDYSKDELANMLIPVFLSTPNSPAGRTALEILGNSRSQLAYHALKSSLDYVDSSLISAIKNASIFHAIKEQIRKILTACSVIVRCMHWEINAVVISILRKAESRIALRVNFLTEERIMDISQENIRNLRI